MDKSKIIERLEEDKCVICGIEANNNHIVQNAILKERLGYGRKRVKVKETGLRGETREVFTDVVLSGKTLCETHNREPLEELENDKFKNNILSYVVNIQDDEDLDRLTVGEVRGDFRIRASVDGVAPEDKIHNILSANLKERNEITNYFDIWYYNILMVIYKEVIDSRDEGSILLRNFIEDYLTENYDIYKDKNKWIRTGDSERAVYSGGAWLIGGEQESTPQIYDRELGIHIDNCESTSFKVNIERVLVNKETLNADSLDIWVKLPFNEYINIDGRVQYQLKRTEGMYDEVKINKEYKVEKLNN